MPKQMVLYGYDNEGELRGTVKLPIRNRRHVQRYRTQKKNLMKYLHRKFGAVKFATHPESV